ncbi:MAG: YjcZ family sporulation protein [Bacilli bacterium]|nr:YjcZ family sporulation protein [Bacilli bacterium]
MYYGGAGYGMGSNFGYGCCEPVCCRGGYGYALILVLFILLVIIGCTCYFPR